jgi:tetrahydromethanopterin S-methyltransferase subunit E
MLRPRLIGLCCGDYGDKITAVCFGLFLIADMDIWRHAMHQPQKPRDRHFNKNISPYEDSLCLWSAVNTGCGWKQLATYFRGHDPVYLMVANERRVSVRLVPVCPKC